MASSSWSAIGWSSSRAVVSTRSFMLTSKTCSLLSSKSAGVRGGPSVPRGVGQLDDMAHLHPVDEDVDLAPVHRVEIEQALIPIEGVEAAVTLAAHRLE